MSSTTKIIFRLSRSAPDHIGVRIFGSISGLGSWNEKQAPLMEEIKEGIYGYSLNIDPQEGSNGRVEYRYALEHDGNTIGYEEGDPRLIPCPKAGAVVEVHDEWREPDFTQILKRSAFKDVILKHSQDSEVDEAKSDPGERKRSESLEEAFIAPSPASYDSEFRGDAFSKCLQSEEREAIPVHFDVAVPFCPQSYEVRVCGESSALGDGKAENGVLLRRSPHKRWSGMVEVPLSHFPLTYQYVLTPEGGGGEPVAERWQRHLDFMQNEGLGQVEDAKQEEDEGKETDEEQSSAFDRPNGCWVSDSIFTGPADFRFGVAGVAIPVFSLRSNESMGIGEFADIKKLVDWCNACGLHMVQVLPINDTTAQHNLWDSYPYCAISSFALHPMFIRISDIPGISSELQQAVTEAREEFEGNGKEDARFNEVVREKFRLLRWAFDEVGKDIMDSSEFVDWFEEGKYWLQPYAAFCILRDATQTSDWRCWGDRKDVNDAVIQKLTEPESLAYPLVQYWYFVQYIAHVQLREAALYATDHGVALKGDLPIGVAAHGIDAWRHPELFNLGKVAGSPPDAWTTTGQNWGLPTYNWEEMAKDNYQWWRKRMTTLEKYFQAYRIDHILGFFRIWEIAADKVAGISGIFSPCLPVKLGEIKDCGIDDVDRLLRPYIPTAYAQEVLGDDWESIAEKFMERREDNEDLWQFKEEFSSEKQLHEALIDNLELRDKLFMLSTSVVLLPDEEEENCFHFRFDMQKTPSFNDLPEEVKERLNELYEDYFEPRQEQFWRQKAMERLPMMVNSTNMLTCGEDLGTVPPVVPVVEAELGILSLMIDRWHRDNENYHYLSVCSTSTHDMANIRQWWEEDAEETQKYYEECLGMKGKAPEKLTGEVARKIVGRMLHSSSVLAILPIQDYFAICDEMHLEEPAKERINEPGGPPHFWNWRMKCKLEDLAGAEATKPGKTLTSMLAQDILKANRSIPTQSSR